MRLLLKRLVLEKDRPYASGPRRLRPIADFEGVFAYGRDRGEGDPTVP